MDTPCLRIFIDTEFTDLLAPSPSLISLGMVSARSIVDPVPAGMGMDEHEYTEEFYIEVPYPDRECTPFVRKAVLPLLGIDPQAFCPLDETRGRILNWLQLVRRDNERVEICLDYWADWMLFSDALDQRVPDWITHVNIGRDINNLLHDEYFQKSGLPEHHALYDARANLYAYRPRPATLLDAFLKMEFR